MIYSISGGIGSGKDAAANYLCEFHGFQRLSFAAPLKDAVSAVFGWPRDMLEGTTLESRQWRERRNDWWAERLSIDHLTPRWVLQYWGTDVLRGHFHDSIWIASFENKLRQSQGNIVITDCRFANEMDAVRRSGGRTIRINRGNEPSWYGAARKFNESGQKDASSLAILQASGVHASEYSSVGLEYDHYIDNNGSLDDLYESVTRVLSHGK